MTSHLTSTVLAVFSFGSAALAQESYVSNNDFDPYVAVLTEIPASNFTQSGTATSRNVELNLSTFRIRATGRIEHYVKAKLSYSYLRVQAGFVDESLGGPIKIVGTYFEGGEAADFEIIESNDTCDYEPKAICTAIETVSVRLPFQDFRHGDLRVQFRNRTSSWRGTVTIPGSIFAHNLRRIAGLR